MRYRISHRTRYLYGETVPLCQNALWLMPRDDAGQRRELFSLHITPTPSTQGTRRDFFGNDVTYFAIEQGFRELDIAATSVVTVPPRADGGRLDDSPPWELVTAGLCNDLSPAGIDACQFRHPSPSAEPSPALADYARESFTRGRPVAEAARDLTARIHRDFRYEAGVTTVQTSVEHVFRMRHGVCQDFAHLGTACLRSLGLAARYVSGYLRTIPPAGQPRLVGADASHAWLAVYCGRVGWLDLDPTNDVIPATDHITVALGRDYGDVTPVKGLFVGGGCHEMTVSVDVEPIGGEGGES